MTTKKQQAEATQQVLTEKQELARARRKALKGKSNGGRNEAKRTFKAALRTSRAH